MLNKPEYVGPGGTEYEEPDRRGWSCIPVLYDLWGRKLDEVVFAYVHALRPSSIRVVYDCEHTDARLWRVTIHAEHNSTVRNIEQEVEVALPEGIRNGYELRCALEARKPMQPDTNGIYGLINFPERKTDA